MIEYESLDPLPLPLIQQIINAPMQTRYFDDELPPNVIARSESDNNHPDDGFGVNECLLRMAQEIEYYRSKK